MSHWTFYWPKGLGWSQTTLLPGVSRYGATTTGNPVAFKHILKRNSDYFEIYAPTVPSAHRPSLGFICHLLRLNIIQRAFKLEEGKAVAMPSSPLKPSRPAERSARGDPVFSGGMWVRQPLTQIGAHVRRSPFKPCPSLGDNGGRPVGFNGSRPPHQLNVRRCRDIDPKQITKKSVLSFYGIVLYSYTWCAGCLQIPRSNVFPNGQRWNSVEGSNVFHYGWMYDVSLFIHLLMQIPIAEKIQNISRLVVMRQLIKTLLNLADATDQSVRHHESYITLRKYPSIPLLPESVTSKEIIPWVNLIANCHFRRLS